MPEYLSPGVYVEEIDAGPKPIEGVSTSTAGAIGVTARGPTRGRQGPFTGKPELVTSFAEFSRKFGDFLAEPGASELNRWALDAVEGGRWWYFPLAVKGFFDNGGQRLYVKRVFSSTAASANGTFGQGIITEIMQDAAATETTLRVRHLIGVSVGNDVTLFVNGVSTGVFQVSAYAGTETLTLNNPVGQEVKGGRDFFAISPRQLVAAAVPDPRLQVMAKSEGDWGGNDETVREGTGLRTRIRPIVGATLKIMADPALGGSPFSTKTTAAANPGDTDITLASTAGLAANDRVFVSGGEYTVTGIAANVITIDPALPAGHNWPAGTNVRRMRQANDSAAPGPTISVWNAPQLYRGAIVELDNGTAKEVRTVVGVARNTATLSANLANAYYEEHRLRVVEAEVAVQYRRNHTVETEEIFPNLRLIDDGSASYLVRHVNERSALIDLRPGEGFSADTLQEFPSVPPGTPPDPERFWLDLTGGADNLEGLSVDDFIGEDGGATNRTGIQAFEDIDEISICLAPGMWSSSIHSALIQHCEILKDRFAILDPQDGLGIEGIRVFREPLDTKYAALYYPWVEVRDPSVRRNVDVAPSGHIAGVYARVDVERGVHKAPANEVIRGITKIAQDVTKREQDMLNPRNINVLRFFPGRGNRVWGARVVTSDSSWKYINVRRLFIFVEESIDEGTQWVVFEPNDEPLWARVRQTIINFLTTVWRSGALQGRKAEEAFFVKCDRSTMTQDDIDNGRLICLIGIAPVKPAEFVIFRIQQKTLDNQTN
jgi:phage tail sheath protein FI